MRKRLDYIDYLRFFAMTGVIFLHIASLLLNGSFVPFGSFDWEALNFLQSFAYSAVAIFFMISGCLLLSDERTGDISLLLRKRLPRLAVPLISWTAAASIWLCHLADDYSLAGFFGRFVPGLFGSVMVHFWFAFSIIALYLLSPLLYHALQGLDKRGHRLVLLIILLLNLRSVLCLMLPEQFSRYLNPEIFNELGLLGGPLGLFILGWYLGSMKKIPNGILLAAAAGLVLLITFASRSYYMAALNYEVPWHNQTSGLQVFLAACIFLLFRQNIKGPGRLFGLFPVLPLSYPIYFFHVIVMELFFGLGWTPSGFPGALLFTAANLLLCYLLLKTAASLRLLCYPVTGMSYAEACRSCNWKYSFHSLTDIIRIRF